MRHALATAQKRNPARSVNLRGFCAVTTTGSGESIGAILAPILTPCTQCLHVQRTWGRSRLHPCSCPVRYCRRRPLEREPARVAPRTREATTGQGSCKTLNVATTGACTSLGSTGSEPWLRPARTWTKHRIRYLAGKGTLCPASPPLHHPANGPGAFRSRGCSGFKDLFLKGC